MPQLLLAVVSCVVDADYISRVEPVPWVLFFVNLVFMVVSSCYVVQCSELFGIDGCGGLALSVCRVLREIQCDMF